MLINILQYLEEAAAKYGPKVAYSDGETDLSFAKVNTQARAVGSFLARKGYFRSPIAVFMQRHPNTITAFYGVINSGCYYVPLDLEMPDHRLSLILEQVKPSALIYDKTTAAKAHKLADQEEDAYPLYDYDQISQKPIDDLLLKQVRAKTIDTDPLYIVFTSGSTGVPKGVVASHRTVIDYIEHLSEILAVDEDTIFGNQTPLYLDACLKELLPVLKRGAKAYIIPKQLFMFPLKLVEFLNEKEINTICWVVTALTMISGLNVLDKTIPSSLKTIAFASEVFPIKQFNKWRQALPAARFINLYGPTETTGVCCYYEVDRDFSEDEVIPIGKAFPNREIILLTEDNEEAKPGECGEICIRGSSLTMGYFRDFAKTEEAFIQNPLHDDYIDYIYRTGDLGYHNTQNELVFVSRKDYQIKHMGHRIELGEIEATAQAISGVSLAAAIYRREKKQIVLFYTGTSGAPEVKKDLVSLLPRYMIPSRVIQLEKMPLTTNSKVDRHSLPALAEN